ncbi:MAG: hypothetical protein LUH07_09740, partial [Lachnospiraceae bacterium]|nr:hypothetical protein [Lachnospiraceae bacterium]
MTDKERLFRFAMFYNWREKMLKKITGSTVLRNMILSYVIILLVVSGIWIFSMQRMQSVISDQNEIIYGDMLDVLAVDIDQEMANAEQAGLSIILSGDIKTLLSHKVRELYDITYILGIQDDLSSLMIGQSIVTNSFLYMKNRNYVIAYNTVGDTLTYYRTYIEDRDIPYEMWLEWMSSISEPGYYVLETGTGDVFYYAYPGLIGSTEKTAFLFLEISVGKIEERLSTVDESQDIYFEVLSAEEQYLVKEEQGSNLSDYQMIEKVSDQSGWIYRGYVRSHLFSQYISDTLHLMVIGIVGLLFVCIIAFWLSFRTSYVPLKNLTEKLEKKLDSPFIPSNEYHYIRNSFEQLLQRQEEDQSMLEVQKNRLHEMYMQYLLRVRFIHDYHDKEDLYLFHLEFLNDAYRVAILSFEKENQPEGKMETEQFCRNDGLYSGDEKICEGVWIKKEDGLRSYFI